MNKLPKEYALLKETDFPRTINGIEFKTKQELVERYEADLNALADFLYDMYQQEKRNIAEAK